MEKTGRGIAMKSCLALLIAFLFFNYLPVSSQQKGFALLNSTNRISSVHAIFLKNNWILNKNLFKTQVKGATDFVDPDCGAGASAIQVSYGSNISTNSTVLNPQRAFDNDINTYSTLHIEGHQKDVEIVQVVSFTTTASASDIVKLYLSLKETLQNHTVSARAYYYVPADGSGLGTPVGTVQNLTNLNVLPAPPGAQTPSEITFSPGVIFNRVRIGVIANSNGNHEADLNLHHVQLTPPPPTPEGGSGTSSSITECQGSVTLSISNPDAAFEYKWYNQSNTLVQTGTTYSLPNLSTGNYVYYVSTLKIGCTVESAKHTINLTVNPKPNPPLVATN